MALCAVDIYASYLKAKNVTAGIWELGVADVLRDRTPSVIARIRWCCDERNSGKHVCHAYEQPRPGDRHVKRWKTDQNFQSLPRQLDSSGGLPKSACLGVLGVPGLTAYFALVKVCAAKAGETVVISSAAGQTGHIVGQVSWITFTWTAVTAPNQQ